MKRKRERKFVIIPNVVIDWMIRYPNLRGRFSWRIMFGLLATCPDPLSARLMSEKFQISFRTVTGCLKRLMLANVEGTPLLAQISPASGRRAATYSVNPEFYIGAPKR